MKSKETDFQKIIRKTGRKPISCKCQECKKQCKTPCLGTPEDIQRLIDNGYKDKLFLSEWAVGKINGRLDHNIFMVQALMTDDGCIFFHDGLCELHDLGLKPTEGRLSHHSIKLENYSFTKGLSYNVAKLWEEEDNAELVYRIISQFV